MKRRRAPSGDGWPLGPKGRLTLQALDLGRFIPEEPLLRPARALYYSWFFKREASQRPAGEDESLVAYIHIPAWMYLCVL